MAVRPLIIDNVAPTQSQSSDPPPWNEVLLFTCVPFLVVVALAFAYTPDDVFITLRYAANFVHGHGLSFNPGQHVQGFTSPLDLAVAIIVYLVPGGFVLLKMKLVSVFFGLLALRETAFLLWEMKIPRWAFRLGCIVVASCPVIAFASVNALETTLEMWLLIALARRLITGGAGEQPVVLGLLAFFAVLARPDAIAPIAFMALTCIFIDRNIAMNRRLSWLIGAVVAALGTAMVELLYFRSLLPNTYYAKDLPLDRSLAFGSRYLFRILEPFSFGREFKIVLLVNVILVVAGIYAIVRHHQRCVYLVALFVGQAIFVLKAGGDYMPEERFLAVCEVPFVVTEILGVIMIVAFCRRYVRQGGVRTASIVLCIVLIAASTLPFRNTNAPAWRIHGLSDRAILIANPEPTIASLWIALPPILKCIHRGELVATSEIGFLGYSRLDLRILDLRGLTNRAVAMNSPAVMKETWGVRDLSWYLPTSPVGRVILEQKPRVIIEFDTVPMPVVLGGRYHLVKTKMVDLYPVSFYVPRGASSICAAAQSS
jgi:hypothetical protein